RIETSPIPASLTRKVRNLLDSRRHTLYHQPRLPVPGTWNGKDPASRSPRRPRDAPMSITFECQCRRRLHASDEMAGRRIRCPNCRTVQRVPRDEGPSRTGSIDEEAADLLNPLLPEDTALLELQRVVTTPVIDLGSDTTRGATFQPGDGPLAFFNL